MSAAVFDKVSLKYIWVSDTDTHNQQDPEIRFVNILKAVVIR